MSHDCDNCPKAGACNIEDLARGVRKAYADQGVVGLLTCMEAAMHSPPPNGGVVRAVLGLCLEEIGPFNNPNLVGFREGLGYMFHDKEDLQKALNDVVPDLVASAMDSMARGLQQFGEVMGVAVHLFDTSLTEEQAKAILGDSLQTSMDPSIKKNLH